MISGSAAVILSGMGIMGAFVTTWAYIAKNSGRIGSVEGNIDSMRQKVDLMFGRMFDGDEMDDEEIIELKRRTKEIEQKLGINKET